ncbi:type 1 glutamine amidotransferase [Leucobacter weissii]|uniref:Type 1 glutamine amidotransferase n=1 Tax=Leucobacter weissii TaxID=1983706 RepID=A0A939MJL6_9MICO|nr:type 1 glutamine amidotransferase [Leucobacter weissii]MBO1902163.1 type 1 glutamine amidotransferase [Leucobacter weissii]
MTRVLVVEHEGDAPIGHIGERLRDLGVELIEVGPDTGREVPASTDGYDGLIVLGGAMGPTDDGEAPWLPATRGLLAEAVDRQLPTLGICLGAQLLSTATGGRVRTIPEGPEVGLHSVNLLPEADDDPLLGSLGDELPVVQWHWLESDLLPPGAELLASSPACTNQAYRLGERAWGLQFHPEALGEAAEKWTELEDVTPLGLDPAQVVEEVRAAEPQLRRTWQTIAERFAGLL